MRVEIYDDIYKSFGAGRQDPFAIGRFMDYVRFHGTYADIPVDEIVASFKKAYGLERVQGWIESFEKYGDIRQGRFDSEDVMHDK